MSQQDVQIRLTAILDRFGRTEGTLTRPHASVCVWTYQDLSISMAYPVEYDRALLEASLEPEGAVLSITVHQDSLHIHPLCKAFADMITERTYGEARRNSEARELKVLARLEHMLGVR